MEYPKRLTVLALLAPFCVEAFLTSPLSCLNVARQSVSQLSLFPFLALLMLSWGTQVQDEKCMWLVEVVTVKTSYSFLL